MTINNVVLVTFVLVIIRGSGTVFGTNGSCFIKQICHRYFLVKRKLFLRMKNIIFFEQRTFDKKIKNIHCFHKKTEMIPKIVGDSR